MIHTFDAGIESTGPLLFNMPHALLGLMAAWPLLGPAAPTSTGSPALTPLSPPAPLGREYDLPTSFTNRRTLSHFFSNTGRNLTGVWQGGNGRALLIGAFAAGVATFGDGHSQTYFASHPMNGFGSAGSVSGGAAVTAGASLALLGLSQSSVGGSRFRAAAYDTSQAVLVNSIYTFALKSTAHRMRPDGSDNMSFPSGHTSNAFAIATVWSKHYGPRAAVPGYLLAGLVGVSRMAIQRHHLSDVVAGAALGTLVGSSVVRVNGGPVGAVTERRFSFALDDGPSGDGVGLALKINLSPRR
jgi:membrane-associated phospholipid phosphatase